MASDTQSMWMNTSLCQNRNFELLQIFNAKLQELEIVSRDVNNYLDFVKYRRCIEKLRERVRSLQLN